jgi:hypothetical protein
MRKSVVIALILLAGSVLLAFSVFYFKKEASEPKKIVVHLPTGAPKRPVGMPALTVQAGKTQPFSKEDVAKYLQTNNLPRNIGARTDLQLENLEFLTTRELSDRLRGASPGRADGEIVAFATIRGTLIFRGGPPPGKPVKFSGGYAVFDIQTGNLLMVGTLEQAREGQPR